MHTSHSLSTRVSAFAGNRLVAVGPLRSVALSARQALDADPDATILIFDDVEQRQVEIDLRGTMADLVQRLAATPDSAPPPKPAEPPVDAPAVPRRRRRPPPRAA